MQQEHHHVEASVLWGWLRFLHNQPLHKRESGRDNMPFSFALWHCVDEFVAGKHNPVYEVEEGVHRWKRANPVMVDKICSLPEQRFLLKWLIDVVSH